VDLYTTGVIMKPNLDSLLNDIELELHQTKRISCPACKRSNAFTVTRHNDGLVWNCYYASCGISGKRKEGMSANSVKSFMESLSRTNNDEDQFVLPESFVQWDRSPEAIAMVDRYKLRPQITTGAINLYYDAREDRLAFVITENKVAVDAVGRALSSGVIPKWLRYTRNPRPLIVGSGAVVVIVEDSISAAVVAQHGLVGCALLGTSLRDTYIPVLRNYKLAYVCLDKDATNKALILHKELSSCLTTRVRMLTRDIKDMSLSERQSLISSMEINHETTCDGND
jgi:ribosomal protein L37AE/L43A